MADYLLLQPIGLFKDGPTK